MKIIKFGKTFKLVKWKGEVIGNVFALDTETELITDKSVVPKCVISTAYSGGEKIYFILNSQLKHFLHLHRGSIHVFHTFAFDQVVITKECNHEWWEQIETNKIFDIALLFKLVMIAIKGYSPQKFSLDFMVSQLLKNVLPKNNDIRLTFGQFIRKDGSIEYDSLFRSKDHCIYAGLDPVATFMCYQILMAKIKTLPTSTNLAHKIHLMGDVALKDINRRGVAVDLDYTAQIRSKFSDPMEKEAELLSTYGFVRGEKGLLEKYGEICKYLNIKVPMTKRGFSMRKEDLEPYNHLPFVKSLLNFLDLEHNCQFLNELTASRIHPYYDSIKVTGRTSCLRPNMQNPPKIGGIRECFIPDNGCVFAISDYSSIEMFTAADTFKKKGYGSTMYDLLNQGLDPHIHTASSICKLPKEEINKDQRGRAKPANYGFLANMSPATFIPYAQGYGLDLTLQESQEIKDGWIRAFPEVVPFFKAPYKANGLFVSETGFIRANCAYTEWLNIHFQGKAAEGAKIALYLNYKSGLKQNIFVHDEIVTSVEKSIAQDVLNLQDRNMEQGMKMVCPMNIEVKGELKERFCK
jgi:DNA polymerase I-like protein with 3'-5' exonuclease and polymerase domains